MTALVTEQIDRSLAQYKSLPLAELLQRLNLEIVAETQNMSRWIVGIKGATIKSGTQAVPLTEFGTNTDRALLKICDNISGKVLSIQDERTQRTRDVQMPAQVRLD